MSRAGPQGPELKNPGLVDVKSWMGNSFLNLNEKKTANVMFGPPCPQVTLSVNPAPLCPYNKPAATNPGGIFDSTLTFKNQIHSVVRARFSFSYGCTLLLML